MKDKLKQRIESLKTQRDDAVAVVNQILGAIKATEDILKELDAPAEEPAKA